MGLGSLFGRGEIVLKITVELCPPHGPGRALGYLHRPTWCRDKLARMHEVLGISTPVVLAELRAKLALMHGE
jgi:hypothetical protein